MKPTTITTTKEIQELSESILENVPDNCEELAKRINDATEVLENAPSITGKKNLRNAINSLIDTFNERRCEVYYQYL